MPATVTPVKVYSGDSVRLEYRFKDDEGVGVDLSAWTFTSRWRRNATASTAVDFAIDASAAATGIVVLTLTGTQTRAMGGSGLFDLQGTNGSQTRTFLAGTTEWTQDITRD